MNLEWISSRTVPTEAAPTGEFPCRLEISIFGGDSKQHHMWDGETDRIMVV